MNSLVLGRRPKGSAVCVAELATLGGFAAYVVLPASARVAGLAVMIGGGLAVLATAAVWAQRAESSRPLAVGASLSAAGLVGSVFYLRSLADEPSAIPLAGVGVLCLSLVGLIATALSLLRR